MQKLTLLESIGCQRALPFGNNVYSCGPDGFHCITIEVETKLAAHVPCLLRFCGAEAVWGRWSRPVMIEMRDLVADSNSLLG